MLNLQRLRMLREVAARGTIAAAAEALFMTPSAVSQQMAVLEREAGVPLLERHGRGVRLTDAGRGLVSNTERILAEIEHAEAELAASAIGIVGHVRVSAFPTAARSILIPALVDLSDRHPNLRVSMVDLEPEEAVPALKARDLDAAITYEWDLLPRLPEAGTEFERLLSERVFLALPCDHPLALENRPISIGELAEEEWIVGRDGTSMLGLVQAATRHHGYMPRTDFHSMDFDVILSAVGAGLGVALGPALAFSKPSSEVAIREIAGFSVNRTISLGIRRGSASNPGLAAVMDAVRMAAEQAAATIPELTAEG